MGKVSLIEPEPLPDPHLQVCLGRVTRNYHLSMGPRRLRWWLLVHHQIMSKPVLFCVLRQIINS